ncbi:MAG TPA: tetratricopeptide repeat protein [Gemmataceae bacterium]|nr:tetratricopeptide repeat protein [Gemmataceae bacterium]
MFPGLLTGAILTISTPPTEDVRAESRKDALAKYGAAIWQARRDRLVSAARQLEAVALQDPDATAPLKELVRIYVQLGREPEAIRIARKVLEKDPADADTAHILARLLFEAGEVKEAVSVAKLAAESPNLADRPDKALAIYRDLATLCDAASDPAAAEVSLRKALRLLGENRKAVLASGLYTPQEIDAELADTHERLGRVLVKQAKFEPAATAFTTAHDLYADPDRANDPHSAARLDWNLSGVYAAKGEPATALKHLESFLKLRPQAVEPYERLVALLRQTGQDGQIVGTLRRYAERDPKNLPLLAILAAELARDPATRAEADFASLSEATNDQAVVRVVVRSHVETNQPRLILDELDAAYKAVADEKLGPARRTFAAEKARVIGDILKAEPEWSSAVFRVAAEDLRSGTRRTHQTWHLLGLLATRHRKLEFAVLQFRQAVRGAPPDTEMDAYVGLIDALHRLRRPADIAAACREGLQSARWTPPVFFHFHLSLALAELGETDAALTAADKAILQAGDLARLDARVRKVWVLHTLGRDEDAVALGKKLLDEFDDPADRIRIRYALAGAYYGAKKYAEWEAELRAILDFDPDHAAACNDLGYHLADQGRNLDEAERLLRHAITIDRAERKRAGDPEPESSAYLDSLGWVLFRKGKLADARELIERAAAMPDGAASGEIWDHLGDVCFRLGDKPAAKDAWDKALTAYATDARAKRDGRPDEVKRKLKRIP